MGVRTDTTSPPKRNVALPGATCCLSSGSAMNDLVQLQPVLCYTELPIW